MNWKWPRQRQLRLRLGRLIRAGALESMLSTRPLRKDIVRPNERRTTRRAPCSKRQSEMGLRVSMASIKEGDREKVPQLGVPRATLPSDLLDLRISSRDAPWREWC